MENEIIDKILHTTPVEKIGATEPQPGVIVATGTDKAIEEASGKAVLLHSIESGEKKPKLGRPRQYPSANSEANPSGLFSGGETAGPQVDNDPSQAAVSPFDEETYKTLVSGGVEMLNEMAAKFFALVGKKNNCSEEEIEQLRKDSQMGDKTRLMVETGAVGCIKKYANNFEYASEAALVIGLGIWASGNFLAYRAIIQTRVKK